MSARTYVPRLGYRTVQAVSDLRQLARCHLGGVTKLVESNRPSPAESLVKILSPDGGGVLGEEDVGLLEALMLTAASPDDDESGFLVATAVLLADRLQGGLCRDDFSWFWYANADHYRSQPPPVRAALMNGFSRGRRLGLIPEDVCPSADDCLTRPKWPLISGLKAIARSMTTAERQHVSRADYGDEAEQHLRALNAVLDERDCELSEEDYWFPAEVVELQSHAAGRPGFAACNALLMLKDLSDPGYAHMEFRWGNNFDAYRKLAPPAGPLLLKAFRYLYESQENWDPFHEEPAPEGCAIPWSLDELLSRIGS